MTLWRRFEQARRQYDDRVAIYHGTDALWTYADLSRRARAIATSLLSRYGLEPGDRVAVYMGNCPAYTEVLLAAWCAGLVAVPVNARLHATELDWILAHAGARLCFHRSPTTMAEFNSWQGLTVDVDAPDYPALAAAIADDSLNCVRYPDLAWLFYTSGTTGRPKGAMLTHGNLLAMVSAFHAGVLPGSETERWLLAAPASHGAGLYMLPFLLSGGAVVIPQTGGFDSAEFLDLLEAHPTLSTFMAPTLVNRLVNAVERNGAHLENLRAIIYGGAPMYGSDILRALNVLDGRLAQIYGQGESPMTISVLDERSHRALRSSGEASVLGSVGVPQPGVEVRIVDEDDREVPVGQTGQILVRGESVMQGYWNDPEATRRSLAGGWLHTGDIGRRDADGYLTLCDRAHDMIISGGMNIYPREVEEILLRSDGVADVAVLGTSHPEWGEQVVAFVVPHPDVQALDEAELTKRLDAHCLKNISRFKRPRRYIFSGELPRNSYGKVLKSELRAHPALVKTGGPE